MTTLQTFTAALRQLAEDYPTDPEGTATVTITVTDPATGETHQLDIQPGQLDAVTDAVRGQLDTFRNAHPDQSGQCGHCGGTGHARTHGEGAAA
ncbi:hypothetical protein [Streptomyces sp. NBC_01304]|uniref:hypothetical protein n=1 Tax=Streptomyces sp. NBC_01304 TaxID=2903818 RepID=UPI002E11686E|nr:hypothetical protein OG430_49110 [Streptomyces sp. NBC_01304]